MKTPPKILYFVAEDWAFVSHFQPMAQAATTCGLDVVIATRTHRHAELIVGHGYKLVPLRSRRGSLNPWALLKSIAEMMQIIRVEQPTIVQCVSLPMAVLGGLAAWMVRRQHIVLALTGLGYVWVESGLVAAGVRAVVRRVIGRLMKMPGTVCVFENAEDPREFGLDPSDSKVVLVGGAGVDALAFGLEPEPPAPPVKIALLSRMIKPKGIAQAVAAVERARSLGTAVELHLFGMPDPSNRTTYAEADLRGWADQPGIYWHGATDDVARVHREHHITMLLSVREGLPKCLVEAAAAGRPIVATDVPGCREVVRDGHEGCLVPFGDIDATAQALVRLAGDRALRLRLGAAAHARFEQRFTVAAVKAVFTQLYRSMLAAPGYQP